MYHGSALRRIATEHTRCPTDLLDPSNMLGDVFDRDRIFYCQSMRLTLDSRLVNQDSSIGGQSCNPKLSNLMA
jgi:hypothetical protein